MQPHLRLKPIGEVYGVTISNTTTSLPSLPAEAEQALIQCETADVRYRLNATNTVTGGVGGGMLLLAGTELVIIGWDNLYRARFYRDGAASAFLNIIYSGESQP